MVREPADLDPAETLQNPLYRRPLSLPEQIAEQLSDAILAGRYRPGDPVREQDLANSFQVSRGPIREALRILEKEGVVRIVPNRGARVTQLSVAEVRDIFEIRAALTAVAVRHLCTDAPKAEVRRLIDGVARLCELAISPDDGDEYLRQSAALARLLAMNSKNMRLREMILSLARQTMRYTQLGLSTHKRRQESSAIWRKAAAAIEAGDIAGASQQILQLIYDSRDAAVAAIENNTDAGIPQWNGT